MDEEINEINEIYGKNMTLEDIPLDDNKTWDAFCNCDTMGVFQFASPVAVPVLKKMQCRNMEELAAANSLIRPGTDGLDDYVKGKKNPKSIKRLDPRLDAWVQSTYGTIVFQEQIMGLISELMGISFGQADIYRRALEKMHKPANKKKVDYFNDNVVNFAVARGFKAEEAEYIRKLIIDNSGYAFNKSHAVCYSYISYYTAWMKVNYPLIFHKTMLNGNLDNLSEFINMARMDNVNLLSPHVNHSYFKTMIENEANKDLRIGFNTINGIGDKAVGSIIANRPYNSINEFFEKADSKATNKKVVEALIKSGAFNGMALVIQDNYINTQLLTTLGVKVEDNKCYMNRKQLEVWYKYYLEMAASKSVPNYEVQISKIKNKYVNNFNLVTEKDNPNVVVIPETLLSEMELQISDGLKTRKKPKGDLKAHMESLKLQADAYTQPFMKYANEICNNKIDLLQLYLDEVNDNGFSFIPHPLEHLSKKITTFKDVNDGTMCVEAGVIVGMTQRTTSNNKKYYWLMVRTPKEIIRVTLWDSNYKKYKSIIKQYGLIKVKGTKGFGGMSCDEMAPINRPTQIVGE